MEIPHEIQTLNLSNVRKAPRNSANSSRRLQDGLLAYLVSPLPCLQNAFLVQGSESLLFPSRLFFEACSISFSTLCTSLLL